ncbi:MAG TPA: 4-hydroxy-tetrahydrodipicolinate reductase, partial [Gammaproteobacteria bacterium]|nr:4-hydroxy-tetrahydrodipicolinate reductase [Gammaproteobacteria bacterium]
MSKVNISITGAAGRMGRSLIEAVHEESTAILHSTIEHSESSMLGADAGELAGLGKLGVVLGDNPEAALEGADVL